jgi:hypothetical protein
LLSAPVLSATERQITDVGLSQISSGLLLPGTVLLSSRAPIGYMAIAQIPTAINQGSRGPSSACPRTSCAYRARELIAKRAKDAADPLKLVIVRDMWLTGFDAVDAVYCPRQSCIPR